MITPRPLSPEPVRDHGPSWAFVIPFTFAVVILFVIGAEVGALIARHHYHLTCS